MVRGGFPVEGMFMLAGAAVDCVGARVETSEVAFSASGERFEGIAGEDGGSIRWRLVSGDCSCSAVRFPPKLGIRMVI